VDCIHLVQDEDKRRVRVNMAIKSGVPNIVIETGGTRGRRDGWRGGWEDLLVSW